MCMFTCAYMHTHKLKDRLLTSIALLSVSFYYFGTHNQVPFRYCCRRLKYVNNSPKHWAVLVTSFTLCQYRRGCRLAEEKIIGSVKPSFFIFQIRTVWSSPFPIFFFFCWLQRTSSQQHVAESSDAFHHTDNCRLGFLRLSGFWTVFSCIGQCNFFFIFFNLKSKTGQLLFKYLHLVSG